MQYIQAAREPGGCFLCEKAGQEASHDRDNLILYRGDRAFVIILSNLKDVDRTINAGRGLFEMMK